MSALAAAGTAAASTAASTATSNALNNKNPETQGIDSAMASTEPPNAGEVPEPNTTSGSQSDKYKQQTMDAAFEKGISSVMNPKMSGKEAGQYQRDYMDTAYGDLNQWEQAGASATAAGQAAGEQQNAEKLQSNQLRSQEKIAKDTNQTNENVAKINNNVATYKAPYETKQSEAQTSNLDASTKQLLESQSIFGKTASDVNHIAGELTDGKITMETAKSSLNDILDSDSKTESVLKAISPMYRKYGKQTKSAFGDFANKIKSGFGSSNKDLNSK